MIGKLISTAGAWMILLGLVAYAQSGGQVGSPVHYSDSITLGNILTMLTFLVAALSAWFGLRDDMRSVKNWIEAHERMRNDNAKIINALQISNERLIVMIEALTARMDAFQHHCELTHRPGAG